MDTFFLLHGPFTVSFDHRIPVRSFFTSYLPAAIAGTQAPHALSSSCTATGIRVPRPSTSSMVPTTPSTNSTASQRPCTRYYGGTVLESVLGDFLRHRAVAAHDTFVVAKCGRYKDGFDFSAARVDESLARLGLDYVVILHCHDIELSNVDQIVNETIPALQKIKESGKARFIGITGLPLSIFTYVLLPPGSVDLILSFCHYAINDTTSVDLYSS